MNDAVNISDICDDECNSFACLLANAFEGDPLFDYICKPDFKLNLSLAFEKLLLNRHAMDLCVKVFDNGSGIAILRKSPGKIKASLKLAFSFVPDLFRIVGIKRLVRLISMEVSTINPAFAMPHTYLWYLAIDTNQQGRGLGKNLVASLKQEFGRVCLQTSNPRNLRFYHGMGFKLTKEIELTKRGPKIWQFTSE